MTDRSIVYDTAIPQTTDILQTSKFAMLGDAFLAMATLGNSATAPSQVVAGLACAPTGPPSLLVNVGPGAIFQIDEVDATGYGDLGTDTNNIYKMGIREALGTLTITPPSTSGFSQVFLVQAILSDVDAGSTVLSYYNSANPAIPFSGPGNSGASQNTTRTCVCTVSLKAGIAAATGSQTTPSPDSGFIGLYAITVANGATTIVSGNIVAVNGGFAPFVNTALPYIPNAVQAGPWVYAPDTGTVNNIVVTLSPAPTQYTAGMEFRVKMLNAPTGATVINANGLGNKSVVKSGAVALAGAEWAIGDVVSFRYDGTNFQVSTSGLSTESIKQLIFSPNVVKFTTAGAWSWTVPAGIIVAKIIAWGAGGGGGFSSTSGGSGGGGGAYGEQTVTVTPAGTLSGTIGTGGAAATSIASNAASGGDTTITNSTGGTTYTAGGGNGGRSGNGGGGNNSSSGGTLTNFVDRTIIGQPSGGTIFGYSGSAILPYAGVGGISPLGGPPGLGGTGAGNPGQAPGSGGGGSCGGFAAGAGARGEVWIYF